MEDIAIQLFKLGDKEHKGFIVKRDMQRLQSEVSLPPDQLEAVFESLDTSHNGYLTLDQFLTSINHLEHGAQTEHHSRTGSETDLSVEKLLNLNVLHKSGELMCEVRDLLGNDTWHQLLAALFSDLNQLLRQISQLEDTLRARDNHHQEELRRLYEELESQLTDEKEKLHKELSQRESALRAELSLKEQQLMELTEQRDQLWQRLERAERTQTRHDSANQTERKNTRCSYVWNEVDDYKKDRTAELSKLAAEQSYVEGFSHAQHLARLQEEGLVKQLKLLREMQENLKSGVKEERRQQFSCDDL